MTQNCIENEVEIELEEDQTSQQIFDPLTSSSESEEEEDDDEDLRQIEHNTQIANVSVRQDERTLLGEEATNVLQDDQSHFTEIVSLNDPDSNVLTEEKIEELIQSRLIAKFESMSLTTQKQISDKERVISPFRQFPKLLLIPNTIEMFASAICICERKRIIPFNLSFVREVFNIGRGRIYRAKKSIKSGRQVGKNGRPCLLNKAEEEFVVNRLKILSLIGWAPTLDETVEIANELIASWLQVDFRVQRPTITSNIWVHEFAKRNNLRITRSSPIDYQRIIVNEEMIKQFFQTLKELYEEKEYTSHLIFNMDETSLKLTPKQTYVVITNQSKKKAFRAQEANGKLMSAVVTISARGTLLKTLILIPTKTIPYKVFEDNDLHNFGMVHSPKGFITKELFYKWTRDVFIPEVEAIRLFYKFPKNKWALLVLDGHSSRADLRAIHLLQQHHIDCVVIPGHSSHVLQPLDVGIFKHFKTELKKQQRHKDKNKEFYLVLDHCLNLATSAMRIVEAFRKAGIYPLNLEKKIKGQSVFPTEVKEFAFSNYNRGSRLKISGQILTSENFINQLTNKEKRKRKAQLEASKKHIPPHKLFQKLFSNMNNPFQHTPFNSNEIDSIHHFSQNSSIENISNRLLTVENNHLNIETVFLETNTNETERNNLLLNGYTDFENNIHLTNNTNRQTLQPILIQPEVNETNRHETSENRPLNEPTNNNFRNTQNNLDNDEIYTPLSPGRTSIHPEKNFILPNSNLTTTQQTSTNTTPQRSNININQTPRITHNSTQNLQNSTPLRSQNTTPLRSHNTTQNIIPNNISNTTPTDHQINLETTI
ncbi:hypothetical protein M0813_03068 [Anaeramoeba flamelloides]|uniref:DDE-1 domain-containing protein n=1 Tax=Anaeramoeba flamelloides TaxID=1746091 RepID=A0ABQ8Y775_9EUKA|nr:hypothetical protein M0813_03068 [Anaeramoeba flamelloides]